MALMFRSVLQNSGGAAELIVTCASEFAGETISCSDGTTTLTKTCPSSSPYTVTFKIPNSGNWTISATVGGTTYTSDPITVSLDYTAELSFGFNWQTWVTAGGLDPTDYTDLADLLTDEKALRRLFLVHDAVDYMASSAAVNADLATVINTDLAAKWINLSDYALDTLYANTEIADEMDTADKYFYGEWVITDSTTTPPTWGPKGNVPVMTSNTAPYGNVIYSGNWEATPTNWKPYYAFDKSLENWLTNKATDTYIGYQFTNPVNVKKAIITLYGAGFTATETTYYLEGSNTGGSSDWITLSSKTLTGVPATHTEYEIAAPGNTDYYLYYRVRGKYYVSNSVYALVTELQFYGRELSVSVPKMTSNTAPYGTASASSTFDATTTYAAFRAFDLPSDNKKWNSAANGGSQYVQYKFTHKIVPKVLVTYVTDGNNANTNITFDFEGSNDGSTFYPLTEILGGSTSNTVYAAVTQNGGEYQYIRLQQKSGTNGMASTNITIYGLDYSEKEFEVGTTKKWLYDHGVELEDMYIYTDGGATGEKKDNGIHIKTVNNGNGAAITNSPIDLTNYSLLRAKYNPIYTSFSNGMYAILGAQSSKNASSSVAYSVLKNTERYTAGLDISSNNQSLYCCTYIGSSTQNAEYDMNELWLE